MNALMGVEELNILYHCNIIENDATKFIKIVFINILNLDCFNKFCLHVDVQDYQMKS